MQSAKDVLVAGRDLEVAIAESLQLSLTKPVGAGSVLFKQGHSAGLLRYRKLLLQAVPWKQHLPFSLVGW